MKYLLLVGVAFLVIGTTAFFISSRPTSQNHARRYIFDLISAQAVQAGQPTVVLYRIKHDKGDILKDFALVHEKRMHLIVVRRDLAHFQHQHPEFNETTGEFSTTIVFPTDGTYRLFADFTPESKNIQRLPVVATADINVGNAATYTPTPLNPEPPTAKFVNGYEVTYLLPNEVKRAKEFTFGLLIKQDGNEVTDLESYLGALGHSVVIRADSLDYLHTHPTEMHKTIGAHTKKQSEATIEFTTTLPQQGIYKIFTQFQHKDKVVTTSFTLAVD